MILITANSQLKATFGRLIKTAKANVNWNDQFAINNNQLVLVGDLRSLFFDFDNRKLSISVVENLPNDIEEVGDDTELLNILNMTLYAFGKWGAIGGLKVEKNYVQLNKLFEGILKKCNITPVFNEEQFKFYQDGIQVTYEDVIQAVIDARVKEEEEKEEKSEEEENGSLGLWHNVCWKIETNIVGKVELTQEEKATSRIGNNFYPVGHTCPNCKQPLNMTVYPVDKELLVDTKEGKVYLARSYACSECFHFYTPKPGKLIQEGELFVLDFQKDKSAYEDYLELLGKTGDKISNYKFNEYERERNKENKRNIKDELAELFANIKEISDKELEKIENQLEDGFFDKLGDKSYKEIKKIIQEEKLLRGKNSLPSAQKDSIIKDKDMESAVNTKDNTYSTPQNNNTENKAYNEHKNKYDAKMGVLERLSIRQLQELKNQLHADNVISESEKNSYINQVEKSLYKEKEEAIKKKANDCVGKSYVQIERVIEEIKQYDCPDAMKKDLIEELQLQKKDQAQREIKDIMLHIPNKIDIKTYSNIKEKLEKYDQELVLPYEKQLDEYKDMAKQQELDKIMNRSNTKDRNVLVNVMEQLNAGEFSKEKTDAVVEEVKNKIIKIDEAAIDKIAPNIMTMSWDEAALAYDEISNGMFLPELKVNILEMLDKRLSKIKQDECELLVKKLKDDMGNIIDVLPRLHFYEYRKIQRGDIEEGELYAINTALNIYGCERGKYEYPIMIYDCSKKQSSKEGFLLTPDSMCYCSKSKYGKVKIQEIQSTDDWKGFFKKGISFNKETSERIKIPANIPLAEKEKFLTVLNSFIAYLKEKPQSRSVAYLAKEKHEVKCCYRCGYTYKGEQICPKCGHKVNN